MGVYIKGMEMPTSCEDCRFHDGWCLLLPGIAQARNERREDCPLVPVPPHGDLIDRDPFVEFIKKHWDSYDQWFVEQLEARPTIIPAEEGE